MHARRLGAALVAVAGAVTAGAYAAPARSAEASAAQAQLVPATSRGVSFVVAGTTTYGTLAVPAHRPGQRLAAALLLPGSGPTDRDGDQPALDYDPQTLKLIAGVLGQQGVMTLRFDKYFSGQTGAGAYASDPGRIDLATFIRQADAAYDVLRDRPETDTQAMLIVGHSEGGFTAMLVDESVRPRPAGLALLEPQDLRLLDLVRIQLDEQLDAALAAGQVTSATVAQNEAGIGRVISEFRDGQPVDTSGLLPAIGELFTDALFSPYNARYTRSDDAIYPPAVAARLPRDTRVLVTCGTADTNVPCSTTPPLLAALARAGTTGPGLRVLSGLDHLLHPAGTAVNDPILAPAAVAALQAFARPWACPALTG
jgi:alpha-beta hydrolase superfamily lysophospholipase